jgi:hypothetical protein
MKPVNPGLATSTNRRCCRTTRYIAPGSHHRRRRRRPSRSNDGRIGTVGRGSDDAEEQTEESAHGRAIAVYKTHFSCIVQQRPAHLHSIRVIPSLKALARTPIAPIARRLRPRVLPLSSYHYLILIGRRQYLRLPRDLARHLLPSPSHRLRSTTTFSICFRPVRDALTEEYKVFLIKTSLKA